MGSVKHSQITQSLADKEKAQAAKKTKQTKTNNDNKNKQRQQKQTTTKTNNDNKNKQIKDKQNKTKHDIETVLVRSIDHGFDQGEMLNSEARGNHRYSKIG